MATSSFPFAPRIDCILAAAINWGRCWSGSRHAGEKGRLVWPVPAALYEGHIELFLRAFGASQ
jgi:hypothetical protein